MLVSFSRSFPLCLVVFNLAPTQNSESGKEPVPFYQVNKIGVERELVKLTYWDPGRQAGRQARK